MDKEQTAEGICCPTLGTLALGKTDCKGQQKKEAFGEQLLPQHEANNGDYAGGMRGGG